LKRQSEKKRRWEIPQARQEIKRLRKEAVAAKIKQEPSWPPTGPFRVLAVDPPWHYDSRADDLTHRSRNPYPDMTVDEIKALPVAKYAHEDSIVWLWTTNAHLREAFDVLDSWGFTYKNLLVWFKDRMGTGDWLRGKIVDVVGY
jgi:N6-adenosine-specific RNA methylase IME4